jgi:hypothetical protein
MQPKPPVALRVGYQSYLSISGLSPREGCIGVGAAQQPTVRLTRSDYGKSPAWGLITVGPITLKTHTSVPVAPAGLALTT